MNQLARQTANPTERIATELNVSIDQSGREVTGTMVNLSMGGCCLNVPGAALHQGERIDVTMPTRSGSLPLRLTAEVRWTARGLAGVAFQDPNPDQTTAIEVMLAEQRWRKK